MIFQNLFLKSSGPKFLVANFSLLALLSCQVRQTSENVVGTEAEVMTAPPSNTAPNVNCKLEPETSNSSSLTFRGKEAKYFSAEEIGYENDDWMNKANPWISFDGLDSTILGFPGFEGNGRSFSVAAPVNIRMVAVDIRNIDGKFKYHYYTNETGLSPMENWSSTKSFAMLQSAHSIRFQTGFTHGMNSTLANGSSVGSKVTDVALTSNNRTAAWFKSITGPQGSINFARNWIGGGPRTEFGGAHGEAPAPFGKTVKNREGTKTLPNAGVFNSIGNNTLMPIVMGEFWKRLAVNTMDSLTWLKKENYAGPVLTPAQKKEKFFQRNQNFSVNAEDLQVLLYGAVTPSSTGGLLLGGTHTDGFVAAIGGKGNLDTKFGGRWRFFGKTGSGSNARSLGNRSESILGGIVCIPANPANAVLKNGRMFAFFINSQAIGSAVPPRQATLKALTAAMIPEITGAKNLWVK